MSEPKEMSAEQIKRLVGRGAKVVIPQAARDEASNKALGQLTAALNEFTMALTASTQKNTGSDSEKILADTLGKISDTVDHISEQASKKRNFKFKINRGVSGDIIGMEAEEV